MPAAICWGAKAEAVPKRERATRAVLSFIFVYYLEGELGCQRVPNGLAGEYVVNKHRHKQAQEAQRRSSNFGTADFAGH